MTEQEWLECADPKPMLEFLRGKVSDRKVRLFLCGCCRRIWHLLSDERSRAAVEGAERFADGDKKLAELAGDGEAAREVETTQYENVFNSIISSPGERQYDACDCALDASAAAKAARYATHYPLTPDTLLDWIVQALAHFASPYNPADDSQTTDEEMRVATISAEWSVQAMLLRCVLGNPFRPITIVSTWLTSAVISLPQAIYDERAFERLPILADALEEAGCTDASILEHCRSGGEHVRGCWVIDLVLGKL